MVNPVDPLEQMLSDGWEKKVRKALKPKAKPKPKPKAKPKPKPKPKPNPKKVGRTAPSPKVQTAPNPLGPEEEKLSKAWEKRAKRNPKPKTKTKTKVPKKVPVTKAKDLGANQPALKWLKTKVAEKLPAVARGLGWVGTAATRATAVGAVAAAIVPEKKFVDRSGYSKDKPTDRTEYHSKRPPSPYAKMRDRNLMADPTWHSDVKFGTVGKLTSASPPKSSKKGQYNDEHMRSLQEMMPNVSSASAPEAPPPLNKTKPKKVPSQAAAPAPAQTKPLNKRDRDMTVPQRKPYEPSGPMERDNRESLNAYRDWAGSKLEKPDAFSQALSNLFGAPVTPGHQTTDSEGRLTMEVAPHAKHTSKHPVAALQEQKERKKKGWSNTAFPQK